MGAEQLEQVRDPRSGFVLSAGGSGSGRGPERGVGTTGRAGLVGVGRRGGCSFTVPERGIPPFYA